MNMDVELAAWRAEWLADEPVPHIDLRMLVNRKTRRMRLALAGQLLWGALILGFTARFASRHAGVEWILWAAVLWIATFLAVGFTLWNKAGTWKALGQSNAAFVDLSRRRCERELQAIHVGRWALAAQLFIVAVWLSIDAMAHRLPVAPYLFGMAVTILLGALWLTVFTARERRIAGDLRNLSLIDQTPVK